MPHHSLALLLNQLVQHLTQCPLTPLDTPHTHLTRNPSTNAAMAWYAPSHATCHQPAARQQASMSWSLPLSPRSSPCQPHRTRPLPLPAIVGALPADILSSSCSAPQALHHCRTTSPRPRRNRPFPDPPRRHRTVPPPPVPPAPSLAPDRHRPQRHRIGRASCRERVCQYV